MSLENIHKANEIIKKLQGQRREKSVKFRETWYKTIEASPVKKRRMPEDFKDSSYLYIRSYDGDNGYRPGANVAYWRSPDVMVSPVSSLNSYTTELNAGTLYNIKCLVHNKGDLNVPSAKVEFYLVTPSLGFDTRFGKKLGIASTWVNCYSSSEVNIRYLVEPSDAGHKCLFARVFSFSPLDIPLHDTLLNPVQDRHIGQKNLNIAGQATQMNLNILHMPQAQLTVKFVPLSKEKVLAIRHPVAADFRIIDKPRERAEFRLNFAKGTVPDVNDVKLPKRLTNLSNRLGEIKRGIDLKINQPGKIEYKDAAFHFEFNQESKYNLKEQNRIEDEMKRIHKIIQSGERKASDFKKEIDEYRQMNLERRMTLLSMDIPNIGLQKGELAGYDVVAINNMNGEIFGGITLLVHG